MASDEKKKREGKIALISKSGKPRNRGTYIIPADEPLVLDLARIDEADLAEITSDDQILKLTSDTPITPTDAVKRYARQ